MNTSDSITAKSQLNNLFRGVTEALDIPESRYKQAEERYQAIGKWLGRNESSVAALAPEIYPQGSFRLGTVIKPISDAEEYDIDLVCKLDLSKEKISQKQLKELVGAEIKSYASANSMGSDPEEGHRCWTLNYSEDAQFHMDVLPAIPDVESWEVIQHGVSALQAEKSIAITDNTLSNYHLLNDEWPRSNPSGYADWFKEQMMSVYDERRVKFAESTHANIEDVPDYKIKTPLQQAVQILKRHRDIMFADEPDNKPISIIITTLAAHAYNNERDLVEALINIVNGMSAFIQEKDGISWIPNPVNPHENFADKWRTHQERELKFRRWLLQVRADIKSALGAGDIRVMSESLKPHLGEGIISEAVRLLPDTSSGRVPAIVPRVTRVPDRFNVSHRQAPIWPIRNKYSVTISGRYKYNSEWRNFRHDCNPLPKHCDLLFSARTDTPGPFEVYWQVVNTGFEASTASQLRGDIFHSKTAGMGGLTQAEGTLYTGIHWVECFIVKNGDCVARSGEFVVNIE
ncbi:MAG: nucleotidyltransferase [Actinobacteria bacterium]|nr:nucleotidyltransferase [Actinomycetota bacterium]MCL5883257.1 nucleotidyltransferase [Actinomycetota bacterium]